MTSAVKRQPAASRKGRAGPRSSSSSRATQLTADSVRVLLQASAEATSSASRSPEAVAQPPATPKRKRLAALDQVATAHERESRSADDSILETPRRGRRLAGIDMGWGSPLLTEKEATAPHTFPRMEKRPRGRPPKRSAQPSDVNATPSKRRGADLYGPDNWPSLVDSQGWASAAVYGGALKVAGPSLSASSSPQPDSAFDRLPASNSSRSSTSFAPRYDAMSLFTSPGRAAAAAESRKILVPVEVRGMGRIAVHRELASQIACIDGGPDHQHQASSSSEMDASSSSASCGTTTSSQPTSVMTPCPSGPSPSFSIASQFPASEPGSPSPSRPKHLSHAEALAKLEKAMGKKPQGWAKPAFQPRLGGLDSGNSALPTLDWPDSPTGPWAMAGSHLSGSRETRLQGIAKWLDGQDDDEVAPAAVPAPVTVKREDGALEPSAFYGVAPIEPPSLRVHHQHPMVTKALRDRARKAAILQAGSPSKAGRRSPDKARREAGARKLSKADSRQRKAFERRALRERSRAGHVTTPKRASSNKAFVTPKPLPSNFIGCTCGIEDEVGDMVQCDACNHWFHLFCLGLGSVEELAAEWFCDGCCERALLGLSPSTASTMTLPPGSSTSSIGSTPLIHRGGIIPAEIHQGLPVFAQPGDTPVPLRASVGLSSDLVLAPSPQMFPSLEAQQQRQRQLAMAGNRLRASRVGQYTTEAGSPLDRKSALPNVRLAAGHLPEEPQTPTGRGRTYDALSTPMLFATVADGHDDWASTLAGSEVGSSRPRDAHTTPSPRLGHASSSLGHSTRGTRGSGDSARRHRRQISGLESDDERQVDHDDIFSTPSRVFGGSSSWSQRGAATSSATHPGLQTPSRRPREHTKEWGMTTPGRNLLAGSFAGDHSLSGTGGMPSLIFSSGGLDHFDGQLAASVGGSDRSWQLQSPTSSTRAGRARQESGVPSTPELMPHRPPQGLGATSSIRGAYGRTSGSGSSSRGSRRHDDHVALESDDLPSSSPYPRTPSLNAGDSPSCRRGPDAPERFMTNMAGPGTPFGSSRRLAMTVGLGHGPAPASAGRAARQRISSNAEALGSTEDLGGFVVDGRKASAGHGQRHPSYGLVGLGLDDFLDFE